MCKMKRRPVQSEVQFGVALGVNGPLDRDELSPHSHTKRTDALFSLLKEEAEEQKITTQLLGFLFHRENYIHDRAVAVVGLKLFHKETITREISLDEGLFMLSSYKLGYTGYSSLRQELKNRVELPRHYRLMQHKKIKI